tara:strand:- start:6684 stop:6977 length:294 start_codon:yes stop_codon:yes gene_type:complete
MSNKTYEKLGETYHVEDDNIHIVRTQDVEPILKENHAIRETHTSFGQPMRLAGRVPAVVAQQWAKECGSAIGTAEFNEYVKKKLMDGDFAKFRIKGY